MAKFLWAAVVVAVLGSILLMAMGCATAPQAYDRETCVAMDGRQAPGFTSYRSRGWALTQPGGCYLNE